MKRTMIGIFSACAMILFLPHGSLRGILLIACGLWLISRSIKTFREVHT